MLAMISSTSPSVDRTEGGRKRIDTSGSEEVTIRQEHILAPAISTRHTGNHNGCARGAVRLLARSDVVGVGRARSFIRDDDIWLFT